MIPPSTPAPRACLSHTKQEEPGVESTTVTAFRSHLDPDRAVFGQNPAGVVRDLPDVAVRISECSRCPAPIGDSRLADDRSSSALSLLQDCGHLIRTANVVGELHTWCTVAPQ